MKPMNLRQLTALLHIHAQEDTAVEARTFPGAAHTYLSLCRRHLAEYTPTDGGGFNITTRGRAVAVHVSELIGEEE